MNSNTKNYLPKEDDTSRSHSNTLCQTLWCSRLRHNVPMALVRPRSLHQDATYNIPLILLVRLMAVRS